MTSYSNSPPPERAGSKKLRADVDHDILPLEPDAPGPVSAFAALVRCTGERDFRGATRARKQLRALGWSCAPCGKGATG